MGGSPFLTLTRIRRKIQKRTGCFCLQSMSSGLPLNDRAAAALKFLWYINSFVFQGALASVMPAKLAKLIPPGFFFSTMSTVPAVCLVLYV